MYTSINEHSTALSMHFNSALISYHPDFLPLLHYLAQPLQQIVHCMSGEKAQDSPNNLLQFNLISAAQLDRLALFFDQIWPPAPQTYLYPRLLEPWIGLPNEDEIDLQTRRDRFGQFIGLPGHRGSSHDGCL